MGGCGYGGRRFHRAQPPQGAAGSGLSSGRAGGRRVGPVRAGHLEPGRPGRVVALRRQSVHRCIDRYFALALVASWLLAPIGSEARRITRARVRIVLTLALAASNRGTCWSAPCSRSTTTCSRRTRSRAIVLYNPGTDSSACTSGPVPGSAASTPADLGKPCGFTTVTAIQLGSDPGEDLVPRRAAAARPGHRPAAGPPRPTCTPGEAGRLDP